MTLTMILLEHWPILTIGLTVGTLAFLVGRGVLRVVQAGNNTSARNTLENLELEKSQDRRSDTRRKGNPVEVDLFNPKEGDQPVTSGWVLDRSRGGLALMVHHDLPLGVVLNARPRTGTSCYSVPVEVRSCRQVKEGFVVGCQFHQMPPWNVLMLFG